MARHNRPFRLYCTTNEAFPIKLVDVVDLFLRELKDRGVEQEWFCGSQTPGPLRRETVAGVPVIVPPYSTRFGAPGKAVSKLLYWLLDTVYLLRFLFKPVDVIQVRDKYFAAVVGLIVARLTGRVFTVWLSYPYPEDSLDNAAETGGLRSLYQKLSGALGIAMLYKLAMPLADHCFVQSEQMREDLHQLRGIALEKMTPVPMGISNRIRDLPAPRTDTHDGHQTVMYLGTLYRVRRLETMIDAFIEVARARPAVRFLIVGDGLVPSERGDLEARVEHAGVADRFDFTGFIPIEQAWQKIGEADICVSPFLANRVLRVASPTKLVEYMAFGKPVVANDHPEHTRVLNQSGGGVCVPWSVEGFANGVLTCLDDPESAREMGRKGREWVLEHRTYDRLAEQVQSLYEQLLDKKHGGR
ncbi:MAG: glycosyltransferase family 4 protein [Burkholderiaceae bacterium]